MAMTRTAELRYSMRSTYNIAKYASEQCQFWFKHRWEWSDTDDLSGYEYCRKRFLYNRKLLKQSKRIIIKNVGRYLAQYKK